MEKVKTGDRIRFIRMDDSNGTDWQARELEQGYSHSVDMLVCLF